MYLTFAACVRIAALANVCAFSHAAEPVYARVAQDKVILGNAYLERTISLVGDTVHTTAFVNRISSRAYPIQGEEFRLALNWERLGYAAGEENPWIVTAADCKLTAAPSIAGDATQKRVSFALANSDREPKLEIRVTYELKSNDKFTRQWLELKTRGRGSLFLASVSVYKDRWGLVPFRLGGFGQPVFAPDFFAGIEYPSGINDHHGDLLDLRMYVGASIPASSFTSAPAVIGVSDSDAVRSAFFDYIRQVRVRPVRPYVLYNTWYDLQGLSMNHDNTLARVHQLQELLIRKYGLPLDSFVLDDGWDDRHHLWRIDESRFPTGFSDLATALRAIGSHLGLWCGPAGGYDDRSVRIAAARREAMEIESNGSYLCIAGRRYSRYLDQTLLNFQKQYAINYFKLDGIPFGCNESDHGHPAGLFSREFQERSFIDLLERLRHQQPDIFLNITTGIWLSPWWLQYADTVWMGGEDSGYLDSVPTLAPRQSAISYRDSVLYDDFVTHQLQFPMSSLMTHGIIKGKYNLLGGARESLDDWKDELVHYFSVGNMMTELYITPELLNADEWQALSSTLKWARAHKHPLLDDSVMILGDPARRQPYGFAHVSSGKSFITVRNPFVAPQTVHIALDAGVASPLNSAVYAETVYPFRRAERDPLYLTLAGYEQRVIELTKASEANTLRVEGARYAAEPVANGRLLLHLYAAPGSAKIITVDVPGQRAQTYNVQFPAAQSNQSLTFSAPSVATEQAQTGSKTVAVDMRVSIPEDYSSARLAFLFEPQSEVKNVTATAVDSGKPLPLSVENGGHSLWQWFFSDLHPGDHNVHFALIVPARTRIAQKLSAWLLTKRQLARKDISIASPASISDEPALPASSDVESGTTNLLDVPLPPD